MGIIKFINEYFLEITIGYILLTIICLSYFYYSWNKMLEKMDEGLGTKEIFEKCRRKQ